LVANRRGGGAPAGRAPDTHLASTRASQTLGAGRAWRKWLPLLDFDCIHVPQNLCVENRAAYMNSGAVIRMVASDPETRGLILMWEKVDLGDSGSGATGTE